MSEAEFPCTNNICTCQLGCSLEFLTCIPGGVHPSSGNSDGNGQAVEMGGFTCVSED